MAEWFPKNYKPSDKIILLGDLNIAPEPMDVWSHKQLLNVVSHTPIEVEKLRKTQDAMGWVDVARHFIPPSERLYSWWSYRARDWKKSNRGRRLDHIWVTPALVNSLNSIRIFEDVRGWDGPSDHVPVLLDLAFDDAP
jgi:exodeoxyribonuclease-3